MCHSTELFMQNVHRYEPYVLGARALLPPFDARFRGYGKDKVSWVRSLQHAGFRCAATRPVFSVPWKRSISLPSRGTEMSPGLCVNLFTADMRHIGPPGANYSTRCHHEQTPYARCAASSRVVP